MILRNFYNMMASTILNIASTDITTFGDGHINYKYFSDGSTIGAFSNQTFNLANIYDVTGSYLEAVAAKRFYICFGSGTTAVTFDDAQLDTILSGIAISNISTSDFTYDSNTKKMSSKTKFILSNNNNAVKTINEIGIMYAYYNTNASKMLVYREVLPTPITLAAGESVTYTHNFEFTMPTIS